jgi:DNA ligase (NAD+)
MQIEKRVEYFASKSCVAISGLGPATVGKLVGKGAVKNVADLYALRREDLLSVGGNGAKSAGRILASIELSKRTELWRFINGLGIPQVGQAVAHNLARHFGDLAKLAHAQPDELLLDGRPVISGVGEGASRAIVAYFSLPENVEVVNRLVIAGVKPDH